MKKNLEERFWHYCVTSAGQLAFICYELFKESSGFPQDKHGPILNSSHPLIPECVGFLKQPVGGFNLEDCRKTDSLLLCWFIVFVSLKPVFQAKFAGQGSGYFSKSLFSLHPAPPFHPPHLQKKSGGVMYFSSNPWCHRFPIVSLTRAAKKVRVAMPIATASDDLAWCIYATGVNWREVAKLPGGDCVVSIWQAIVGNF